MQSLTLLIVDDEELVIEVIKEVTESIGLRTLVANNGKDALALIESERPDVILCDLNLPDLDGHVLCQKVRMNDPCARLVLMTGEVGAESGACSGILRKPFGINDLTLALSRAMETA